MKSFLSYINQLNSIEAIGRHRLFTSLFKSRDIGVQIDRQHSSNLYKLGGVSLVTMAGFLITPTSAQAAPVNLQFSSPICVGNPTASTTTASCLVQGSKWRFNNVVIGGVAGSTQRDAFVTITSLVGNATISNIDTAVATTAVPTDNLGDNKSFQPFIVTPTTNGTVSYAVFTIQFIDPATSLPVALGGEVYETAIDVDGGGATGVREMVEFVSPSSTYLSSGSFLSSSTALRPGGTRYVSNGTGLAGISPDDTNKATALYSASTTSFDLLLGSTVGSTGSSCGSPCNRQSSVSFLVSAALPINDLAITKSHTGNFTVGLPATYTITAINTGAATSGNTVIRDPLPTGLTIPDGAVTITGNTGGWSCTAASNVITCTTITPIPARTITTLGSSSFNITGIAVGSAAVPSVSNTATITTGGGSITTNDAATDVATVINPTFSVSGTVFNDANGGTINGTGTNAGLATLTAYLVSTTATPLTLAKVTVGSTGNYNFLPVVAGNYTVRLSNDATGAIGSAPPAASLPTNYVNTGEGVGTTPDATVDGSTAITVGTTSLTNVNFGIDRLPTTTSVSSPSQTNPGLTATVVVPTLAGTDPEDGALGNGKSFRIVTLPTNGILYYPNASNVPVAVTAGQLISNYDSTKLTLDPDNGGLTVTFTYAAVDAAGQQGSIATVTMPFIGTPLTCNSMYGSYTDGVTFRSLRQYTPPTTSGSEIVRLTGSGNNRQIAAIAIDPILDSNGNRRVYYTENNTTNTSIYYYDNTGNFNTNTLLTVSPSSINIIQNNGTSPPRTLTTTFGNSFNRMGFDPNGILYITDGQNKLYRYTPDRSTAPGGTIPIGTLSGPITIGDNPQNDSNRKGIGKLANSGGGDIAFDSQGRMFIVTYDGLTGGTTPAVDNPTEFRLFLITGASGSAPVANLLGVETNPGDTIAGIAFQNNDNKLYMQGSQGKSYNWNLALNDISTVSIADPGSADLGSCTYPVFNATTGFIKTVANITNPTARVLSANDILEYTLTVANTGNFVASNAQVADPILPGMTYVAGSTKLNTLPVADLVTSAPTVTPVTVAMPYATAKQVNSLGLSSGSVATGATNAAKVVFRVTVDATNTKVCNQANFSYDGATASIPSVSDDPTTATVGDTTCTGIIKAGLVMVKRITGIKPAGGVLNNVSNPNDGTSLNSITPVHNPADTNNNDTNTNWPTGHLKGAYDAGKIKPGDEIEYTVYYLNSKGASASNLQMCDPIRGNQAYVAGTMQVQPGGSAITNLTDAIDTDQGNTYGAAALPAVVPTPTNCNAANTTLIGSTDRGGISIGIAGAVPSATAAGIPPTSYGLFRFRTRVNP